MISDAINDSVGYLKDNYGYLHAGLCGVVTLAYKKVLKGKFDLDSEIYAIRGDPFGHFILFVPKYDKYVCGRAGFQDYNDVSDVWEESFDPLSELEYDISIDKDLLKQEVFDNHDSTQKNLDDITQSLFKYFNNKII